jgi:hypothetical protein
MAVSRTAIIIWRGNLTTEGMCYEYEASPLLEPVSKTYYITKLTYIVQSTLLERL